MIRALKDHEQKPQTRAFAYLSSTNSATDHCQPRLRRSRMAQTDSKWALEIQRHLAHFRELNLREIKSIKQLSLRSCTLRELNVTEGSLSILQQLIMRSRYPSQYSLTDPIGSQKPIYDAVLCGVIILQAFSSSLIIGFSVSKNPGLVADKFAASGANQFFGEKDFLGNLESR
jgi:hypothetical protein